MNAPEHARALTLLYRAVQAIPSAYAGNRSPTFEEMYAAQAALAAADGVLREALTRVIAEQDVAA